MSETQKCNAKAICPTGNNYYFYGAYFLPFELFDGLGLSVIAQYLSGRFPDPVTQLMHQQMLLLSFVRVKWNF
ncbi:MAG: hypothetical protein M1292_04235 [Bacteroidetes bacterium]|nr:hypothetical protein [Bacteroidota bacterium]